MSKTNYFKLSPKQKKMLRNSSDTIKETYLDSVLQEVKIDKDIETWEELQAEISSKVYSRLNMSDIEFINPIHAGKIDQDVKGLTLQEAMNLQFPSEDVE